MSARDLPNKSTLRCAIYTRKSSEDGLEQDFNSLDAQRESCAAYIKSQRHEGWVPVRDEYDDGGYSGGTLQRPALTRLLSDIEAGKVQIVVVYKVDRLTRSLSDFAKIVDVFDKSGASFVSITQQFNTTTSMGRLTLNMLLSFAQFEREVVTGERIRDKISASKKKGMWMGGPPPLGYDVKERKLIINEGEAETVRHIYRRYLDLNSVRLLKEELDRDGIVSKIRHHLAGQMGGGKPIERGALYAILRNRLYIGEIAYDGVGYPGEHAPILDRDLWDRVQHALSIHRQERKLSAHASSPSLLAGLLFDDSGEPMTPTHAVKNNKHRYRYYVSRSLISGTRSDNSTARRIPAADLERLVDQQLGKWFSDADHLTAIWTRFEERETNRIPLVANATAFAKHWSGMPLTEKRSHLLAMIKRIDIHPATVTLQIKLKNVAAIISGEKPVEPSKDNQFIHSLVIDTRMKRVGHEMRIVISGPRQRSEPEHRHSLLQLLRRAFECRRIFEAGNKSITEMAHEARVSRSYFARACRIGYLAPELVSRILDGQQPIDLTAIKLIAHRRLPLRWEEQRTLLGFAD